MTRSTQPGPADAAREQLVRRAHREPVEIGTTHVAVRHRHTAGRFRLGGSNEDTWHRQRLTRIILRAGTRERNRKSCAADEHGGYRRLHDP